MCGAPSCSTIRLVARETVVIRLELHLDDESLTGRASDGTGTAKEFVGWIGLVGAIDALVPGSAPVRRRPSDRGFASCPTTEPTMTVTAKELQ
jgi:hypothetical protein